MTAAFGGEADGPIGGIPPRIPARDCGRPEACGQRDWLVTLATASACHQTGYDTPKDRRIRAMIQHGQ